MLHRQLKIGLIRRVLRCYKIVEFIPTHPNQPDATKEVAEFNGTDFNLDHLQTQLNLLHTSSETSLTDLKSQ